ncbi:hypothetical protein LT85_3199 [Collimonas arenae]|uniref:Uncharacterized protein n=1 Tax=Collimonas arenae TaxID=279058 RepID=A0A0A1FHK0_9BURK|nr:hypothetical protein LT85_3199 [Collimonas arenae]
MKMRFDNQAHGDAPIQQAVIPPFQTADAPSPRAGCRDDD